MQEAAQPLTALNMDDDYENTSNNQTGHKSANEHLMERLRSRGIHCATAPSRAALVSHLRKYPKMLTPALECLRNEGDGLFELTPKQYEPPFELLIDVDLVDRNCMNFYNRRTRFIKRLGGGITTYIFDYRSSEADRVLAPIMYHPYITFHDVDGQCIHWRHLNDLKRWGFWHILKHPMVLNYVNERLMDFAVYYFLYLAVFVWFLLTMTSNMFSKNMFNDVLITIFVSLFLLVMVMKLFVARAYKSFNFWFGFGCAFHTITFAAALAHVWLPYLFEYESWALPFFAVISAWINFLYILRKGPTGIYIIMMARLLKSFGHIATIWIPTMFFFTFAFQLVLKDSGIEPWNSAVQNATTLEKIFVVLQAFTKTATMMIGEVEGDNILGTRQWTSAILLLIFEIFTVILLMNLMTSLAVGDVNDLREESNSVVLGIKINFVIESLQLAEAIDIPFISKILAKSTNNMLEYYNSGDYFAMMERKLVDKVFDESRESELMVIFGDMMGPPEVSHCPCCQGAPKDQQTLKRQRSVDKIDYGGFTTVRGAERDITTYIPKRREDYTEEFDDVRYKNSYLNVAKKWLIGLDWNSNLDKQYKRGAMQS